MVDVRLVSVIMRKIMTHESQPPAAEESDDKTTIEGAVAEIEMIRGDIFVHGANDSEFERLNEILEKLKKGTYSREQAIAEAYKVSARKMDYH